MNLDVYRGDDYVLRVTWQDADRNPIDLTGYTARLQIRQKVDAPDPPWVSLDQTSGITLGGTAGTIDVHVTNSQTSQLSRNGVYDLELKDSGGKVTTILRGDMILTPDVTR